MRNSFAFHLRCVRLLWANDAGQHAASRVCGTRNCPADDFYIVEYRFPLGRIAIGDLWRTIHANVSATSSSVVVSRLGCQITIVFHIPTIWTPLFGRNHYSSIAIHIANGTGCWFLRKRITTGVSAIEKGIISILDASNTTGILRRTDGATTQIWIYRQTQEVSTWTSGVVSWPSRVSCKVLCKSKSCPKFNVLIF